MFRSDSKKFCFIHIPKTGGTSIKKALIDYAAPGQITFDGEKVTDAPGWHPHRPPTVEEVWAYWNYFYFIIVRNPWGRHASLWKFLTSRQDPIVKGKSFEDYIVGVSTGNHPYSMNYDYYLRYHDQVVDYIGFFEDLELSWRDICARIEIDHIPLPHMKDQGNYDYREMYTNRTKDLIYKHCKMDIETFEYEF